MLSLFSHLLLFDLVPAWLRNVSRNFAVFNEEYIIGSVLESSSLPAAELQHEMKPVIVK